ncbi:hormogonium polysaccharide biosynthesis protein HpsL [Romeriopsis navalis]|uniref:hormogonium polysaccharide biosynthesis protein HpsL n=1 Tax=Romeriopsis navalis TaxID=2992132 RepID=UPI0021F8D847|nr:hormogonium polysaccharide biosynthesis protein HpsL [Romeriopsis navalis]
MPRQKKSSSKKKLKLTKAERQANLKEQLAQKRASAKARQEFTKFISMVSVLAVVCAILIGIVGGVKGAVAGFGGAFCLLLSFKYPWKALYAFLIYLPLSGTVTYVIGGGSPIMQLAKDAFYFPALIGVIQYCKRKRIDWFVPQQLKIPLFTLLGYCLLVLLFINGGQQLFPICEAVRTGASTTCKEIPLGLGILGLKVFLGYVPLISCAYYLINTKDDVYRIMRLLVVLILICCSLGFVQYIMLKTGRCQGTVGEGAALFKASLGSRCLVGGSLLYSEEQGVIRLPGTFVAPWQWGWYLIASAFFSFAVAFSDRVWYWRLAGMAAMAETMTMAVLSGQRIALALVPVCFGILLVTTGQVANLTRFLPILMVLGLAIVGSLAAYPEIVQERLDSFISRWNAAPPTDFIVQQFDFVQDLSGALGRGLGRATNSARALGDTKLIETYFPKVMYEIGPLGLLLFLVLVTTLTVVTFQAYRQVKDKNLRGIGAALWTFVLVISYNTYYYPLDVDPVAVYYWFAAGIVLKLPVLDQQKNAELSDSASTTSAKRRRHGRRSPPKQVATQSERPPRSNQPTGSEHQAAKPDLSAEPGLS